MASEIHVFLLIPIMAALVAYAIERFGPRFGGSIAALPLITGATLAAIAVKSDVTAVRTVAFHALIGGFAAIALFRVYAWLCPTRTIAISTIFALIAFFGVAAITGPLGAQLFTIDPRSYLWLAVVATITIAVIVFALPERSAHVSQNLAAKKALSRNQRLAIRITVGTLFGYATIYVNAFFGPALAGAFLALPPVALPQMFIEHRLISGASAREFILGRNRCHCVPAVFFAVLSIAATEISLAGAFALAFALSACAFVALWFTPSTRAPSAT